MMSGDADQPWRSEIGARGASTAVINFQHTGTKDTQAHTDAERGRKGGVGYYFLQARGGMLRDRVPFQNTDPVVVVVSEPRCLLAKVHSYGAELFILVAHAPHFEPP